MNNKTKAANWLISLDLPEEDTHNIPRLESLISDFEEQEGIEFEEEDVMDVIDEFSQLHFKVTIPVTVTVEVPKSFIKLSTKVELDREGNRPSVREATMLFKHFLDMMLKDSDDYFMDEFVDWISNLDDFEMKEILEQ